MQHVMLIVALLLSEAAGATSAQDADRFFHFNPGTTESLEPSLQQSLKAATADFAAVVAGRPPTHAVPDPEAPVPSDGGTTFWRGPGYTLTILKSLDSIAGVHGYSYGPIIRFAGEIAVGNHREISDIRFYPRAQLQKLLGQ